ncbi:MAG: hypothetical protein JNK11_06590 [Alphaproteobacteria bacterium]|nr:hypothetical protein [Alphaproteobacteria bacterium]
MIDVGVTRRGLLRRLAARAMPGVALGLAAATAACGRRSDVKPPDGAENTYPRGYPPGAPATPPKQ